MNKDSFSECIIANLERLPVVEVKTNGDFALEVTRRTVGVPEVAADGSNMREVICAIDANGTSEFIESISTVFAEKINSANEHLKVIGGYVEDIRKEFDAVKQKSISLDPFLVANYGRSIETIAYEDYPFWKLNAMGSKMLVVGHVAEVCDFKEYDFTNLQYFKIALDRYPARAMVKEGKDVSLSAESIKALAEKVNAANKDLLLSDIEQVIKTITSSQGISAVKRLVTSASSDEDVDKSLLSLLDVVYKYKTITSKIDKVIGDVGLSVAEISAISKNVEVLDATTEFAAYVCFWHRTNTFADTYLMRCGLVNPDVRAEAIKLGIKDSDATKYMAVVQNGRNNAVSGILLKQIVNGKESVDKQSSADDAQKQLRIRNSLAQIDRDSFITVMSRFFATGPAAGKSLHIPDVATLLQHKSNYMTNKNMAVEDVVYNVIFTELYHDSFEGILYDRVGLAYVKMIASNPNITSTEIDLMNVGVYSELITEFIARNFLK